MKLAAMLLLLAISASASPMLSPDGTYHAAPPSRLETPDGVATIGNPDALLAYGWAYASPERIAAEEAARAAAQQEAEASQFPTPEVIVPVLNADGEPTGTARLLVDDLGNLVVVTDTASPRRPAKVQLAEFKTKRMAHAARLEAVRVAAAKGGGLPELRARVEALEALHGIGLKTDDGTAGSPGKPEDPPGKPEDPPGKPNKPGK